MTTTSEAPTGTDESAALTAAAKRVDTMLERVELLDPAAATVARDLKAALEAFHREGLVRIVRRLKEDPRGKELLFELVDDPGVYALLVMHGIVRADPTTLAQRALTEVRPYLESHGGGVELVEVTLPVARVRLSGTCNGCSSASSTLREVVERALVSAVPGLHQVEVVKPAPEPTQLGAIGLRPGLEPTGAPTPETGWTPTLPLSEIADGRVTCWRPEGMPEDRSAGVGVALVRIGERISAYEDACAHQGMSLERGMVDAEGEVLTCPWHGLKYQALTGEAISMIDRRLTTYPARVHEGRLWLRLP